MFLAHRPQSIVTQHSVFSTPPPVFITSRGCAQHKVFRAQQTTATPIDTSEPFSEYAPWGVLAMYYMSCSKRSA